MVWMKSKVALSFFVTLALILGGPIHMVSARYKGYFAMAGMAPEGWIADRFFPGTSRQVCMGLRKLELIATVTVFQDTLRSLHRPHRVGADC